MLYALLFAGIAATLITVTLDQLRHVPWLSSPLMGPSRRED